MPIKPTTPQTANSLGEAAKVILEAGESLRVMAETLTSSGIESIDVTHYASFTKAIDFLDNYVAAVRTALVSAKRDRGDFVGKPGVSASQSQTTKKPAAKQRRSGHTET